MPLECKLYHYAAGTSTDKDIWLDEAKTMTAPQPILSDSRGIITFYGDGNYKFIVRDSSNNTLYTWDNVRITSDSATMWEGNHGTAYPSATSANIWQLFAKHTAGNVLQELGINNGSAFVPLVGIDSNLKYAADTGVTDAYLIAPNPPITAYTAGQIFYMKALNANTGASTINVNSLGIKSIKRDGSIALTAGDILAGEIVTLIYDGTNFQLVNAGNIGNSSGNIPISNGTVNTNLNAEQHNGLKVKVIDIGDWNMDSTSMVSIAHGLTFANIRNVSVLIRDDINTNYTSIDFGNVGGTPNPQGQFVATSLNINITRLTSGFYDSTSYDSISYNRGWITIWHIA